MVHPDPYRNHIDNKGARLEGAGLLNVLNFANTLDLKFHPVNKKEL